jgi:tRNA A-37 threonylcarbamoyl transferase component Bud32/predicted nucleotidyltransferase
LTLTTEERSSLRSLSETLAGSKKLVAVCAYGSKVAGYARPESDYDVIAVISGLSSKVQYKYVSSPLDASVLLVDDSFLVQDARASALGEFVVGRLLNVYEPIMNAELLRQAEVEFKRRVIIEALWDLSSDYGDFAKHLRVPLEYFLFDKLRRRSLVYPPALYSYVKTYTCPSARANTEATLAGFREAAASLTSRGFMELEDDTVKIVPQKMRGDAFTKVLSLFSVTARGVTQYAVHGYAGRVGIGVFKREASSKLKRLRERPEPPPKLERPRSLLRLEEGFILDQTTDLAARLARVPGFGDYTVTDRSLGEPYATTRVLTYTEGAKSWSCVVKNFSDVRSLKWAFLGIWAAAARKFNMSPLARLEREYSSYIALRRGGVSTPRVIAVAPDERIMVTEFVEGTSLSKMIDSMPDDRAAIAAVSAYGEAIARAHGVGISIGDAKASNVIVSDRGLFLTDLEQAAADLDPSWDVAEFLYYTAKLSNKESVMKAVADTFLASYIRTGDRSVVKKARSLKYLTPFQPIVTPGMTRVVRDAMEAYS